MSFAHYPPTEGDFLISRAWDKLMAPGWRDNAKRPPVEMSPEAEKRLIEQVRQMKEAPGAGRGVDFDTEEADAVTIERRVPMFRGKWRLLPPEVERGTKAEE